MDIMVNMDSALAWGILAVIVIFGALYLINKGLEQREKYRRENEDFFKK